MRKRKLLAVILLLLMPSRQFATSIVIIIANGKIYAASDSKSTLHDIYGRPMGTLSIPKIFVKDGIGFAVAGHDDQTLRQLAEATIVPGRGVRACSDSFRIRMSKHYLVLMRGEKKTFRSDYDYYLKNQLAGVVFFQVKGNIPIMLEVALKMKEVHGKTIISDTVFAREQAFLGFHDHIDHESDAEVTQKINKFRDHLELLCADLVQLELSNHRDDIGCPIKTFIWTQAGYQWANAPCH